MRISDWSSDVCSSDLERIWLLQHPPLYTAGTSADPAELIDPRFPVHAAGRGGRYTYHGPGQRIGYLNIDLRDRGRRSEERRVGKEWGSTCSSRGWPDR